MSSLTRVRPERATTGPVGGAPVTAGPTTSPTHAGRGNAAMCALLGGGTPDHGALRQGITMLDARVGTDAGWRRLRDGLSAHFAAEERGQIEVYGDHPRILAEAMAVAAASVDPEVEVFVGGLEAHATAEDHAGPADAPSPAARPAAATPTAGA